MDTDTSRSELAHIVDRLAAGDAAFTFTFVARYGAAVTRAAVEISGDAPERLVHDVAFALLGRRRDEPTDAWDVVLAALAEVLAGADRTPRPPGGASPRSVHLVDIENLAGGPARIDTWFAPALRQYRAAAAIRSTDHVVVAADRAVWVRTAWEVDPGWDYRPGTGADGADRVLLAAVEPAWVAKRFERLVVGSGDHGFAPLVADVVRRGVAVDVVARPAQLAGALRRTGARLVALPDLPELPADRFRAARDAGRPTRPTVALSEAA